MKLYACLLMVLGSATVATLTSILTAFVVTERFERLLGRGRMPAGGHVVVVGLGSVGSRTLAALQRADVPAAGVDIDAAAAAAPAPGTAVVTGDARLAAVLEQAHVATARAVVAVTGDDAVNLGVALLAEKINPKIRGRSCASSTPASPRRCRPHLDVDVAMGAARVAAPMFVACALEDGVAAAVVSGDALHVLKKGPSGLVWTKRALA